MVWEGLDAQLDVVRTCSLICIRPLFKSRLQDCLEDRGSRFYSDQESEGSMVGCESCCTMP